MGIFITIIAFIVLYCILYVIDENVITLSDNIRKYHINDISYMIEIHTRLDTIELAMKDIEKKSTFNRESIIKLNKRIYDIEKRSVENENK